MARCRQNRNQAVASPESRPSINYILDDPFDDQYQSKSQQKKLLRAATIKARVNAIHTRSSCAETEPIDGPISFHLVDSNRVIMPHYDALMLTLCINGFYVHKVLVDLGNVVDLLQLPAFRQMKLSSCILNSVGQILSCFNGATSVMLGDVVLPVTAGPIT